MPAEASRSGIKTDIGHANASRIEIRGLNLVDDLMGNNSFTEATLLALTGNRPSEADTRVVDSVLICLIDHGLQPSALAARMTYYAAPEAVQGALGAGILGAGKELLGSMEQVGEMLSQICERTDESSLSEAVSAVLDVFEAKGARVPGFGHALHRTGDPRSVRLIEIGRAEGVAELQLDALQEIARHLEERHGRTLAPNATGAAAALLLGVGLPWNLLRGIAVMSRVAGLLAHIGEEATAPITPAVRDLLREASWLEESGDE